MEFSGDGSWPTLNLEKVDEFIADMDVHLGRLRQSRDDLARLTGARPATVTKASVRAEVSSMVIDRAHTFAAQGDDERLPRVRALDIGDAADLGVEDAAVQLSHENQLADSYCHSVRSEATNRYNARLGRIVCRGFDAVFEACAEDAAEQGQDPGAAVIRLSKMLAGYMADAAHRAIPRKQPRSATE
ncbi:hypothetical protein [Streptomyces sp. NPDC126933]|uniref:hypothetical protein n=1 Tax=unclassified Streptomyces TaxID=2593676 RepID=UPI00365E7306